MSSSLVVLSLGYGDLENGFPAVTAELRRTNNTSHLKVTASLPAAPEINQLYRRWRLLYQALSQCLSESLRLEIIQDNVIQVSEVEFQDLCQQFKILINRWLNSEQFRPIDQKLRRELNYTDEIRVIIETKDSQLRRLPWHLWNFLEEDYPKAEIALSSPEHQVVQPKSKTPTGKVRILAILGNSNEINTEADCRVLKALPSAESVFLLEPQRWELDEYLWDKQGWDILFFAGHSQTEGETGKIYLNQTDSLTIADFKNSLRAAISHGLQLAIFNSCDGLGLARQLEDLHLNQFIVMREPVSDLVAQEFLKHFLGAFAEGETFYLAVRKAREKLQALENKCFCASWLPVICQNPAKLPPTWRDLRQPFSAIPLWRRFRTVGLFSLAVTSLLIGVRQLGLLQPLELQTFDQLMRLRPAEPPDQRILVIKVTEEDIQAHGKDQKKSSLSDQALEQLLQKLEPLQPRVIGLDIYRDFPVEKKYPDLATRLGQSSNFIGICKVGDIPAPPEISPNRIGFSDIVVDPDGVVRGQLLGMAPPQSSPCQTDKSLSLQAALHYLEKDGIQAQLTTDGNLKIGSVTFPNLEANTGGYHQLDAWGFQVMLNYRAGDQQNSIQQVTLGQVLAGEIDPKLVRDRVILIGTAAASIPDYHLTPYSAGKWPIEKLPGVVIHAHMVSQILSAVLDQRTLLWVWPKSGEMLWIGSWSLVGGILGWRLKSKPLALGVATFIAIGTLSGLCFLLLLQGGWVPLVPSVFALTLSAGSLALIIRSKY